MKLHLTWFLVAILACLKVDAAALELASYSLMLDSSCAADSGNSQQKSLEK